jgi:hypothetical protein
MVRGGLKRDGAGGDSCSLGDFRKSLKLENRTTKAMEAITARHMPTVSGRSVAVHAGQEPPVISIPTPRGRKSRSSRTTSRMTRETFIVVLA